VRSILDGHIVLDRKLAHAGHYPAIDVLASVSRLVGEITDPEIRSAGHDVRRLMAAYREKEDLIAIGAYQLGTDPLTDAAIGARAPIEGFLRQGVDERSTALEADAGLASLAQLALGVEPAAVQLAAVAAPESPGSAGGTPLHTAIPALSLAS
jgi:flagellum-specific ATP synthase